MGKYYKKTYYRGKRDKYSVEQTATVAVVPAATATAPGQSGISVVPATSVEGMRKVKHITVSLAMPGTGAAPTSVYWALVYVPQGTGVGTMNIGSNLPANLYEPNQFVMNCGVIDFEAGPARVSTRLSRNLNSGDQIALLLANPSTQGPIGVQAVVRYAVTLQ